MNIGLIIGNVASVLAAIAGSLSATRKTAKGMLFMQMVSQGIFLVAALALGGYSGAAQNVVGIVRNIVAMAGISFNGIQWVFAALVVVLGLACNNLGLVGLLPIIGNFEFSLAVFRFKDNERALKIAFMVMNSMFMVYDFFLKNYAGVTCTVVVLISAIIYLVRTKDSSKAAAETEAAAE